MTPPLATVGMSLDSTGLQRVVDNDKQTQNEKRCSKDFTFSLFFQYT